MQSLRQWRDVESDESLAARIAAHCSLPLPLGRLLAARGVPNEQEAERFLAPRLSRLGDPFLLPDMRAAVDRIRKALAGAEQIVVFGDYDADGVTATALLVCVLRALGARVDAFLPHRVEEGYGFTPAALTRCLATHNPSLVITVDCGVCSVPACEQARAAGVDVVVTDHHAVSGPVSKAVAVVNPACGDDPGLQVLAGVGVAFKLCHALVKAGLTDAGGPAVDLRNYLDLVAIGTIADVVPLTGENRILVAHGLKKLNADPLLGVGTLAETAGIEGCMDSDHVAFVLGPRLNAAGRMGDARPALELLLATDPEQAGTLARELDAANRRRKEVEGAIVNEAVREIDVYFETTQPLGLVVGASHWHIGTVGIVASRLSARYRRPAVVIGWDADGLGRGSCRSVDGVSLVEVLEECSDELLAFGGHALAAGVTLRREAMDAFRQRFDAACRARIEGRDLRPVHQVDGWIHLADADTRMQEGVARLEPFGVGNRVPLWGVRDVSLVGPPRTVGTNHLKMTVAKGGDQMQSIGFGLADRPLPEGPLDLLFHLKENEFRGRRSLELHVKDFRGSVRPPGAMSR